MKIDAQLHARDAKRNIGAELLQAVQELQAGKVARKTNFEPLPDGSVRRTITLDDGTLPAVSKRRWHQHRFEI